jgi:hypothetical protein
VKGLTVFALALGGLIVSIPLFAHHGNAAFDSGKRVTLNGAVTEWFWANPHCALLFDVKDGQGQVVHWVAEASNPPDMVNRGWSKASLKPGDQVTITLEPVKNGRPIGRIVQVVLPNGQKLSGGYGSLEGGPQAAPDTAAPSPSKSNDSK